MRWSSLGQRTLTVGERITVQLLSKLTRLDVTIKEKMLLFVCIETTESKPVKQETSCTLILPRVMKIQCNGISPLTLYIVALQIQQKRIK